MALDASAFAEYEAQGMVPVPLHHVPGVLDEAPGQPPAVFVHGELECLSAPTVAIVGTRGASTYGKAVAEKFAFALAKAGVTVISGGALGIDAAAHRGAINAGGKTVAVLACGVEMVYPAVHAGLFREIRESGGCLLSQFALESRPNDYKFLMRNGLVAALSLAVLVVEAPARSGAIRTANDANELGREVLVVPANIDNIKYQGSFRLLREGATFVHHPDQVLEAIGVVPGPIQPALPELSEGGASILEVMTSDPLATEIIVERTGLSAPEVLSELTMLELEGRIVKGPGGYAIKP